MRLLVQKIEKETRRIPMKKLLSIVLVACMILAIGAFSAFADEGDLIGISMPTKSLERWNRDGTYLKEQFEAAGYKVELTYSDNDAVKQNNDISNMIADGVKVLIISAIPSSSKGWYSQLSYVEW